jgi:hypothetical protein
VAVHPHRLSGRLPFPAPGGVLTDQFFLLRIHRHHRVTGRQKLCGGVVDVAELGVAVRMLRTLLGLERRLQPVTGLLQQPRHRRAAHPETLTRQAFSQLGQRLGRP